MTLVERRKVARQARRYGYMAFAGPPKTVAVNCPLCRERVAVEYSIHQHGGSITRHLDAGMLDHLVDCPGVGA